MEHTQQSSLIFSQPTHDTSSNPSELSTVSSFIGALAGVVAGAHSVIEDVSAHYSVEREDDLFEKFPASLSIASELQESPLVPQVQEIASAMASGNRDKLHKILSPENREDLLKLVNELQNLSFGVTEVLVDEHSEAIAGALLLIVRLDNILKTIGHNMGLPNNHVINGLLYQQGDTRPLAPRATKIIPSVPTLAQTIRANKSTAIFHLQRFIALSGNQISAALNAYDAFHAHKQEQLRRAGDRNPLEEGSIRIGDTLINPAVALNGFAIMFEGLAGRSSNTSAQGFMQGCADLLRKESTVKGVSDGLKTLAEMDQTRQQVDAARSAYTRTIADLNTDAKVEAAVDARNQQLRSTGSAGSTINGYTRTGRR